MRLLALVFAISLVFSQSAPRVQGASEPGSVFVDSSFTYVDSLGDRHVVGVVVNTTRYPIEFVKVTVRYYDAADTLLLQDWAYTEFNVINPAGSLNPSGNLFDVSSTVPAPMARYDLSVDWRIADGPANDNFHYASSGGRLAMFNDNTTVARFVKVVETCYNTNIPGQRVTLKAAGWTYVDSNATADIRPGQSAPFQVDLVDPDPSDYQICTFNAQSSSAPSLPTTMTVTPTSASYGTPIRLSGMAQAGDEVTAESRAGDTWQPVGTPVTAGPDGAYSMMVPLTFIGLVRVRTPRGPSVAALAWPSARVTLRRSVSTIRHGGYVTLSGTVRPYYPGKTVTIERLTSLGWRRVATATLTSASTFSVRVKLSSIGTYKLRATICTQLDSVAGSSPTVTIKST